jgi:uncharacterized protein with PIN domain
MSNSEERPRFICDTDCIKIAHWLRSLGYDCAHYNELEREECDKHVGLFQRAHDEKRILITRSTKMLERRNRPPHFLLRKTADDLEKDYESLAKEYKIKMVDELFYSRCTLCNCEFDLYPSAYFTGGIDENGVHYEPHEPFPSIPATIRENNYELDGKKMLFKKCKGDDIYLECGQLFWWGQQSQKVKDQFKAQLAKVSQ